MKYTPISAINRIAQRVTKELFFIVDAAAFAEPFCSTLSGLLLEAASEVGEVKVHTGGTYVCMEGPLFSTKAESKAYRSMGMDIIGMTALPEAKLDEL